jgi:hypothetical protein
LSESTSQWNDAVAGFFAGLSMYFYPSTSLMFYVLLRLIEVGDSDKHSSSSK